MDSNTSANASTNINNISISQILKTLTATMKKLGANQQDIAIMQKEFLNQFGIEVSDNFIPETTYKVSDKKSSCDVEAIKRFLEKTDIHRICVIMLWKCALHRRGKPTKDQSIEICHIIDTYCDGWKRMSSPMKFKEYGSQRGWERIEKLGDSTCQ